MNTYRILIAAIGTLGMALSLSAADGPTLDPHLEPLRPLLEKTFKGEFKESTPEKPMFDVARWERALNGKAVRIIHSVNNGIYGGESIVRWDEEKQGVTYHYFTTADFRTEGTMTIKDGKITTHEIVKGKMNSIQEVRAEMELRKDGTYTVKAEYMVNGKWSPGREATYKEDSTAKVVFK
jgi:hypothetical protein